MAKTYSVYIITNPNNTVLYIGITANIRKRIWQHKQKLVDGFSKRYNVSKLIYVESYRDVYKAIAREKQLKKWSRQKKETLVNEVNPSWRDIYEEVAS